MSKIEFKNMKLEEAAQGLVAIKSCNVYNMSRGKYLDLTLVGDVPMRAKYWNYIEGEYVPQPGDVYFVTGKLTSYKDSRYFNVNTLTKSEDVQPMEFFDYNGNKAEENYRRIVAVISALGEIPIAQFTLSILEKNKEQFLKATAAKSVHHDYMGGLAQHTREVVDLVYYSLISFSDQKQFPNINVAVALCGAALHDIGKIKTYACTGVGNTLTTEGELYDHIFIGANYVSNEYAKYPNAEDLDRLVHVILAHHDKLEWGSPVVPKTMEAKLVHHCDAISAHLTTMQSAIDESDDSSEWTEKVWAVGAPIYK